MEQSTVLLRTICALCQVHQHRHLKSSGHCFVPGDMPIYEVLPWELRPGDVVASSTPSTIAVTVYRRP